MPELPQAFDRCPLDDPTCLCPFTSKSTYLKLNLPFPSRSPKFFLLHTLILILLSVISQYPFEHLILLLCLLIKYLPGVSLPLHPGSFHSPRLGLRLSTRIIAKCPAWHLATSHLPQTTLFLKCKSVPPLLKSPLWLPLMESNFLQPVCMTGVLTWEFPQHVRLLNRAWTARIPEPLIASGLKLPSLSVRFQMVLCHVRKDREAQIRGSPSCPTPASSNTKSSAFSVVPFSNLCFHSGIFHPSIWNELSFLHLGNFCPSLKITCKCITFFPGIFLDFHAQLDTLSHALIIFCFITISYVSAYSLGKEQNRTALLVCALLSSHQRRLCRHQVT